MYRRAFLPVAAAAAWAAPLTKRQRMLQWLEGKAAPGYTPAAFFLHFAPEFKAGLPAAKKHLEFFRATDMDFVKIQFEQTYERQPFLKVPADWSKLQLRKKDFYEPLLVTVRELVRAAGKDALVVMTLYSPFMCAGHCAGSPLLRAHLEENPDAVKRGLETLTESQMIFVRECIAAGVDGFYMSSQGADSKQYPNSKIFREVIQPSDLVAMKEVSTRCQFNILHVCDYVSPYYEYEPFEQYPGQVVNSNTKLAAREMTPQEIGKLFGRPYMGGLDRHGVLTKGTMDEAVAEVRRVLRNAPPRFLLGADCTVPGDTEWSRLRKVIDIAHGGKG